MTDAVRERCELLVNNRAAIRKGFLLEKELMSVAAGVIFTTAGKTADVGAMKACRKLLNKHSRPLSNLRDIVELALISKMALAPSPEKYLDDFLSVYKKVQQGKLLENDFMVLSSILILDLGLQDGCDEIISKANELTKRMKKDHPILTSTDDASFITFLAISNKSVDQILADLEEGYEYLTKTCKARVNADPAYELCEVLAVSYGDMKEKCDKVMRIFNAMMKRDAEYGSGSAFSSLGAFIDVDAEPETVANEIVEAELCLKDMKGFGGMSMDRRTRVMFASLIVAGVYGKNLEAAGNSVIANTLALVWAKQIASMISTATSVASSVVPAVLQAGDTGTGDAGTEETKTE
ncbi:MAG: DUF4003 family protein [Clostridiales bacterium]|nr:DUF4003 family protein [Clostridiales bacterium]